MFGMYLSSNPAIILTDPYIVEDAYVKNNKYLSKDPFAQNIFYPLMGESILL